MDLLFLHQHGMKGGRKDATWQFICSLHYGSGKQIRMKISVSLADIFMLL